MKMKRIIISLLIVVGLIFGAYFWLIFLNLDWREESRKKSPEGDVIAFHMQSMTEAGVAPYGDHIMLVPRYKFLGQSYVSPVFAGYCGQEFDYQWIGQHTLEITCTTDEKIIRKETLSNGLSIKYKIHNTKKFEGHLTHFNAANSSQTDSPQRYSLQTAAVNAFARS